MPDGFISWEYLNKLCHEGLEQRYHPVTEELKKRLDYELSTIKNMGYVDYFLIVWDFIKYARDNDIMVGPGRGSAAGSLVAYTLGTPSWTRSGMICSLNVSESGASIHAGYRCGFLLRTETGGY